MNLECGSSQRLQFLVVTKRSVASGNENGLPPYFVSYIFQKFKLGKVYVLGNRFKINKRWFNAPAFQS